jgi:hypothetical protein
MARNPNLGDVRARRAKIARELQALQAEDRRLQTVEEALVELATKMGDDSGSPERGQLVRKRLPSGTAQPQPPSPKDERVRLRRRRPRQNTTAALIVDVLRTSTTAWRTANEIQEEVGQRKGQPVPMSTISPTLSDMKAKGLIVRDGLKVALKERVGATGAALAALAREVSSIS